MFPARALAHEWTGNSAGELSGGTVLVVSECCEVDSWTPVHQQ